uniref:AN1-type zinc finger protein 2A isoform X1 n=1 Tax=Jaculus jaculus TaxID=51337 RepID=UPI001E1B51F1|nr:AN1-type zinc finger protein 2A isoform X1 [Jaculus jaculus]
MEFPDLGKHCSERTCKQLDFLPVTCDACKQDFCKDHFSYTAHECPFAFKKDVQVPVCPLCDVPIPVRRGETPDVAVGEHIDRDCAPRPGRGEKVFTYRCSKEGCKKKEMLQLACVQCHGNFCIQHRHPLDHSCRAASCSAGKARGSVTRVPESKPSGALNALSSSWLAQQLRYWSDGICGFGSADIGVTTLCLVVAVLSVSCGGWHASTRAGDVRPAQSMSAPCRVSRTLIAASGTSQAAPKALLHEGPLDSQHVVTSPVLSVLFQMEGEAVMGRLSQLLVASLWRCCDEDDASCSTFLPLASSLVFVNALSQLRSSLLKAVRGR